MSTADIPLSFLGQLAHDIKSPVAFAVFVSMFVTTGWLAYDHVSRAEFLSIEAQIKGVQYTLEHGHIDSRIHSVQDKIFDITQRIAEDKTVNPAVARLYAERMDELRRQEQDLTHDMNLLEHQQQ